jgi:hypothetical protein
MSLYDLTGNKVSFTYGRLVQVASGSYYDGFGNPINLTGSGTTLVTGSTYPITSSWSENVVSASYALTASYALNGGGIDLITGSTYPITSSWVIHSINVDGGYVTASGILTNGDIIPNNPSASLGTVEFPFKSISISSGSLIIANADPLITAAVLSNNLGNLDISSGGVRLVQQNSSFIAPTGSFSYLSSSFKQVGDRILIGNDVISGSLQVTNGITSSLYGTSSWSNNTVSASYALTASYWSGSIISSSYSLSASYALTASYSDVAATSVSSLNAQDILLYVKNTSGAVIPKGKVVRITNADNSENFGTIGLADYSNDNNSANTLGFTNQSFGINAFGYVMTEGYLVSVNTNAFSPGDILFLSGSGSYTNVVPVAPKHGVRLGQVVRSQLNNGTIYVRIDNGYELGELHDIIDSTTTSSYGDLLIKSGSVWINSKNLTGSYILSGSLTTNDGIIANSITVSNLTASNLSVTGTLYASTFSSSTIYITSSEFIVADNIITLNALNPHKRYAGLELHDSGSNNFSSLLWDSQNNYLFVSSSETVGNRQIILGPDNQVNLISNYIPLINGGNTITSSIIYQNNSNIGVGTTSPSAKVDVVGDVQANAFYGKSFNLTTTSGQSAIFDTFTSTGTGEVYEVTIKGNPNAGESSNYQDVIYGKIIVGTGKTGSVATTFINYVQESPDPRLLYSSGGNSLTASVYFNSASVDVTQKGVGQSTSIRVVVGSYAVGYVGNNTTVRVKQIL